MLLDKNRINLIDGISDEYSKLNSVLNNELNMKIVSAKELNEECTCNQEEKCPKCNSYLTFKTVYGNIRKRPAFAGLFFISLVGNILLCRQHNMPIHHHLNQQILHQNNTHSRLASFHLHMYPAQPLSQLHLSHL